MSENASLAVVVHLLGGLGNQMFQYAAARALSVRCGAPLVLDASWLSDPAQRRFALQAFRIAAQVIKPGRSPSPLTGVFQRYARRWNRRYGRRNRGAPVYREASFRYDGAFQALHAPVYLYGYFQSEKYFADISDVILEDFQVSAAPRSEAQALLDRIRASDAICVHVRRGDYVSDPSINAFHGLCPPGYYRRGLHDVASRLARPECFVFSDEPAWCRENLKLDVPTTIVDIHGPDEAHEDLRLMAACHSFVIANSSLSWWGAWLSRRAGKRVVAPQRWFQTTTKDTRDLIPNDWLRL